MAPRAGALEVVPCERNEKRNGSSVCVLVSASVTFSYLVRWDFDLYKGPVWKLRTAERRVESKPRPLVYEIAASNPTPAPSPSPSPAP